VTLEELPCLCFYLPIIIFEAMVETNANEHKADESTVIEQLNAEA